MGGTGSGRPKNPPSARKLLKEVIPVAEIFAEDELNIYNALVDIYMKDFEDEDLSAGDIDDVMTLATNKVLEIRLLRTSKGDANRQLDITTSIEKLRKQTEKIKESLSTRRRDRIDPNDYKGFSIVDLAVSFDQQKKSKMEQKALKMKREQKEEMDRIKHHPGNRYDVEAEGIKKEND